MRKLLLISLLAVAASPAMATASAQCDAKPFTLKRPAAIQPASAKPAAPSTDTLVAQAKPPAPKAAGKEVQDHDRVQAAFGQVTA
jgi:hypothetical protein